MNNEQLIALLKVAQEALLDAAADGTKAATVFRSSGHNVDAATIMGSCHTLTCLADVCVGLRKHLGDTTDKETSVKEFGDKLRKDRL